MHQSYVYSYNFSPLVEDLWNFVSPGWPDFVISTDISEFLERYAVHDLGNYPNVLLLYIHEQWSTALI